MKRDFHGFYKPNNEAPDRARGQVLNREFSAAFMNLALDNIHHPRPAQRAWLCEFGSGPSSIKLQKNFWQIQALVSCL